MEFKQTAFLKPYTKCTTEMEKEAAKEGKEINEQNVKFRNTSIFGISIENQM